MIGVLHQFLIGFFHLVSQETDKFRKHMMERLSKKDIFGNSLEEIVGICSGVSLSSLSPKTRSATHTHTDRYMHIFFLDFKVVERYMLQYA